MDGMMSQDGYDAWQCEAYATSVSELRAIVYFRRQWRRTDGTLYPLPELAVSK